MKALYNKFKLLTYVGGGRCVLLVASNFKGVITTGEVRDIVGHSSWNNLALPLSANSDFSPLVHSWSIHNPFTPAHFGRMNFPLSLRIVFLILIACLMW